MLEIIRCPIAEQCLDPAPIFREFDTDFFCPIAQIKWYRAFVSRAGAPEIDRVDTEMVVAEINGSSVCCDKTGEVM